jgi:hypothetical protein
MTRYMGRLPVPCHPCRPWATVHACELGGRPWKERDRVAPLVLLAVAGYSIPACPRRCADPVEDGLAEGGGGR